jgi:hypothetical protein
VQSTDPKPLLVFDSLISFHTGQENDAAETRRYMQGFRRLADMGASVLILHHSGKGETTKDFRGSSDIKAAIDAGWHLTNFGEGRLDRMRLRTWKCRFAIASDLLFRYRDGEFLPEEISGTRTVTELLIDLLRSHPGIRTADFQRLAQEKGLGRDRAREFLDSGIASNTVRRERGPHNSQLNFLGSE